MTNPAVAHRQKMLFLSWIYPSFAGSGSQLRGAAILRLLAQHADIHLLIASYCEAVSGPEDAALQQACRDITHLRVRPDSGDWLKLNSQLPPIQLSTVECPPGGAPDAIVDYFQQHGLDCLFVFRFDALSFVYPRLEAFPVRYLDLDEVSSRRENNALRHPVQSTLSSATMDRLQRVKPVLERALIPKFRHVFVSSEVEAAELARVTPHPRVSVLSNIYQVQPTTFPAPPDGPAQILFVGTFFYHPNIDAVLYFCRDILPLIQRQTDGEIHFCIVGMGSPSALEMIRNQPGVRLLGYQEDLKTCYAEATVVAVPLRAGTGTRLKILEAFAYGRPVVSTTVGAEGLAVTDRKNILIADEPASFARACLDLIEQPELARQVARNAAALHRDRYSYQALVDQYARIAEEQPDLPHTIAKGPS